MAFSFCFRLNPYGMNEFNDTNMNKIKFLVPAILLLAAPAALTAAETN